VPKTVSVESSRPARSTIPVAICPPGPPSVTPAVARVTNRRDAKVSEVEWTLSNDQATYEALLRLIFEDPVPIMEDDMKRLKRAP